MNSWERFDEISLPSKEKSYSFLNIEAITDINYKHAKRIFKEFKINNFGHYRNLYVKSDTLLLADIYQNFINMCLQIYELDPAYFYHYPD